MKNKKGITLIALVITIIVLLILAGVSMSLVIGDNGLLSKSKSASSSHGEAEIKEQINMAYSGWKIGNLTGDTTELKGYIEDKLDEIYGEENVSISEEDDSLVVGITLRGTPYSYKLGLEGNLENYVPWKDNGDGSFTKGDTTLRIGDYVAYDHTKDAQGNDVTAPTEPADLVVTLSEYEAGWQVLGFKNGKIQLLSSEAVCQRNYYSTYCIPVLNNICAIYGHGKGAQNGRCINANDINEITGYKPRKTGDGLPYDYGQITEYGNEIDLYWGTQWWDSTSYQNRVNVFFKYGNVENHNTADANRVYTYYDASNNVESRYYCYNNNSTGTDENQEWFAKVSQSYYYYYPTSLTTDANGEQKGLDKNSKIYKLLFGENSNISYWLATAGQSVDTPPNGHVYLFAVLYGRVGGGGSRYIRSGVVDSPANRGVRPLITLSNDCKIVKNETYDGSTKEKACLIQ